VRRLAPVIGTIAFAWLCASCLGALPTYEVLDLGTLGGDRSYAEAVNSRGDVVGLSDVSGSPDFHAFLYSNGAMTDLGTLGGDLSWAHGINDLGQIVGSSHGADGNSHAFLYTDGEMIDLGTLGGRTSTAYAINNAGQVVGISHTADGPQHAFLYSDGVMHDLGTLGGIGSAAFGISEAGEVVGLTQTADQNQVAFLYKDGQMRPLADFDGHGSRGNAFSSDGKVVGTAGNDGHSQAFVFADGQVEFIPMPVIEQTPPSHLEWTNSYGLAVNADGDVVGTVTITTEDMPGSTLVMFEDHFVYSDGQAESIRDLLRPEDWGGWYFLGLADINDNGQIAASASRLPSYRTHAVLLTPIPEPASLALLTLATAACALTRRRRR